MIFLDQSQKEEEREAKEKEKTRKRELVQAKALAAAKERTAKIFKLASVGISLLMLVAVYAMIEAQKSRGIAEKNQVKITESLLKQASRSHAIGMAKSLQGENGTAAAW